MLKYKLDEIESWAKKGEAISHHVVMSMVKEIKKLKSQKLHMMEALEVCSIAPNRLVASQVIEMVKNQDNNNET